MQAAVKLKIDNVSKVFGKNGNQVVALDNTSFEVKEVDCC